MGDTQWARGSYVLYSCTRHNESFLACHDEQPKHTDEQVLNTGQGSRNVMAKSVKEG
jgi:hypothetical protein